MALFIRQDEERTKLQERLASELQERAKERAKKADLPDGVDDSQFIKNTKMTSSLGWIWIVVGLLAVIAIIWLTVLSMTR